MPGADWRLVRLNPPDGALRPYESALRPAAGRGWGSAGGRAARVGRERPGPGALRAVRRRGRQAVVPPPPGGRARPVLVDRRGHRARRGRADGRAGADRPARADRGRAGLRRASRTRPHRAGWHVGRAGPRRARVPALGPGARDPRERPRAGVLPFAALRGGAGGGEAERWLAEFAELDPAADGAPGLCWCGEPVPGGTAEPNLRRFRERFPGLLAVLHRVLSGSGELRAQPPRECTGGPGRRDC